MGSRHKNEKRRTAKIPTYQRRGEDPSVKAEESGAFQKSDVAKKSGASRNIEKNAQKIGNSSIYDPLKEEFMIFVNYLNILESKMQKISKEEISLVIQFLDTLKHKSETYLNFLMMRAK